MIELSRTGDVSLVCDACRKPFTVAGQAVVLRGAVAAAKFAHQGTCHKAAEWFLASCPGWIELVAFVDELRVAVGAGDQNSFEQEERQ